MLNLLIGESTRWRDAYITIGEPELPILYKIHHKLPMLRSVQIQLSDVDGVVTLPPPIYEDLFENAPQLRRLCIDKDPSWRVDWSGLTVISSWSPSSMLDHLDILSRVSCLEELTIRGEFMTTILPNTVPPITLPFLKILPTDSEDVLFLFRTPPSHQAHAHCDVDKRCGDYSTVHASITGSNFVSLRDRLSQATIGMPKVAFPEDPNSLCVVRR